MLRCELSCTLHSVCITSSWRRRDGRRLLVGRLSVRFFQGDERLSIDWEDGLPLCGQKSRVNICLLLPHNRTRLKTLRLVAIVMGGSGKTQLTDEIIKKC